MKYGLKIGEKEYKYKKDAIAYYKAILNSYSFGESLSDNHLNDLIDLFNYFYFDGQDKLEEAESENEENCDFDNNQEEIEDVQIEDIKVAKVQFNTKCFEVFYTDNTSQYISYLMMINKKSYSPEKLFYKACRNAISNDMFLVKQDYFDKNSVKGQVKCQETGELLGWSDLVVDHRQPNTFSIIVDRFKEINQIDIDAIEFTSNDKNHIVFKDEKLTIAFKMYHKEKAKLRIIKKECNLSRTAMARVKQSKKDLLIK